MGVFLSSARDSLFLSPDVASHISWVLPAAAVPALRDKSGANSCAADACCFITFIIKRGRRAVGTTAAHR